MAKPDLKSPSFSDEAQIEKRVASRVSDNKKSTTIIILIAIIICLLLIIVSLLISPSPSPVEKAEQKKEKIEILIKEEKSEQQISEQVKPATEQIKEKNNIEEVIKKEVQSESKKNEESLEQERKLKEEALDKKFNNKISDTLTALEKNQFSLAAKELEGAETLKPDDPIIIELKERINIEIKKGNIEKLIKKAQIEEKNEQWKNALISYEKILKIDSNINSILVKKQRTISYIKINETLNKIINKPERLQNDKVLQNAKNLLKFVKLEIKEKEAVLYPLEQTPLLTTKITIAEKTIKEASIPVSVTIRSDNLTDVTVYKVGQFGKLTEKKLNLRPGKYTIVGSRVGYRDFRKNLKISAGDHSKVIIVECRETI